MSNIKFNLIINKGVLSQEGKREFSVINKLNGHYELIIRKVTYRGTRTKYHFGHVLNEICSFLNSSRKNLLLDSSSGELIEWDTETLHSYHKSKFNSCLAPDIIGKGQNFISIPTSTKNLNDTEFINMYEEEIIEYYSSKFAIEFMSREDYAAFMKSKKSA